MAYITLVSFYFCRGPHIGSFIRAWGVWVVEAKKKAIMSLKLTLSHDIGFSPSGNPQQVFPIFAAVFVCAFGAVRRVYVPRLAPTIFDEECYHAHGGMHNDDVSYDGNEGQLEPQPRDPRWRPWQ